MRNRLLALDLSEVSGPCAWFWDAKTGERIEVELFVAALGASNFTFAEATATQRGPDFIASHMRARDSAAERREPEIVCLDSTPSDFAHSRW